MKKIIYRIIKEGQTPVIFKQPISKILFNYLTNPPPAVIDGDPLVSIKVSDKMYDLNDLFWDICYGVLKDILNNQLGIHPNEIIDFDFDYNDNEVTVVVLFIDMKTIVYKLIYEGKEPVEYRKKISDDLFTFLTSPIPEFEELDKMKRLHIRFDNLTTSYRDMVYDIFRYYLNNELYFDNEEIEYFNIEDWNDNEIFVEVLLY